MPNTKFYAEKITVNGFSYDWGALRPRFRKVREELPLQMAAVAQNFFVDSFQRQGWYDGLTLKRWKPRKGEKGRRKKKGRRGNRGILVKTGRLRRSIRMNEQKLSIIFLKREHHCFILPIYKIKNRSFSLSLRRAIVRLRRTRS